MELTCDNNKGLSETKDDNKRKFWNDSLIQHYFIDHYQSISSKKLDEEFNNDITMLTKTLSKLNDTERKEFVKLLSSIIEFYLENKIEKEIDRSFYKLFKF